MGAAETPDTHISPGAFPKCQICDLCAQRCKIPCQPCVGSSRAWRNLLVSPSQSLRRKTSCHQTASDSHPGAAFRALVLLTGRDGETGWIPYSFLRTAAGEPCGGMRDRSWAEAFTGWDLGTGPSSSWRTGQSLRAKGRACSQTHSRLAVQRSVVPISNPSFSLL